MQRYNRLYTWHVKSHKLQRLLTVFRAVRRRILGEFVNYFMTAIGESQLACRESVSPYLFQPFWGLAHATGAKTWPPGGVHLRASCLAWASSRCQQNSLAKSLTG